MGGKKATKLKALQDRRMRAAQRKKEAQNSLRIAPAPDSENELEGDHNRGRIRIREITLRKSVAALETMEQQKRVHKNYLKEIDEVEKDIMQRTVFVSNVKNLRQRRNLNLLQQFFNDVYGPIEECSTVYSKSPSAASYSGPNSESSETSVTSGTTQGNSVKFPSARIRFQYRSDAERIFGCELAKAKKKDITVPRNMYGSLIVHKSNKLTVQPTKRYENMIDTKNTFKFHLSTSALALGHWYSDLEGKDIFAFHEGVDVFSPKGNHTDEWIEEIQTNFIPVISFDLHNRSVLLKMHINPANKTFETKNIYDIYHVKSKDMSPPTYSLSFRFKDLVQAMELRRDKSNALGDQFSLMFALKYPPKIYEARVAYDGISVKERLPAIFGGNVKPHQFGSCLGYKLQLNRNSFNHLLAKTTLIEKLQSYGVFHDDFTDTEMMRTFVYRNNPRAKLEIVGDIKTDLLLQSIIDRGYCCAYYMLNDQTKSGKTIFQLCRESLSTNLEIMYEVLEEMADAHERTKFPAQLFENLMETATLESSKKNDKKKMDLPDYCLSLPRLMVSPTRVMVFGFETEMSNRIVRKFVFEEGFDPSSFCRVCLGDENGDQLYTDTDLSEQVIERFTSILLNGIVKGNRHYCFLAYSSSQLKESSIWMVSETNGWTVEKMREWMGNFDEDSPSKLAARMGQCFSTTFQAIKKDNEGIRPKLKIIDDFPDIEIEHDGLLICHSDGTGIICKKLLHDLCKQLPFAPSNLSNASILQIRFGGAKGTLAGWPLESLHRFTEHPDLLSNEVFLRPSMIKFEAKYNDIEIVKVGAHAPYYLNRHVILLLTTHGVEKETFCEMQRNMMDDLDNMLIDANNARALLPHLGGADNGLISTLMRMLIAGIEPQRDPFLFSCLHSIRAHHLTQLRKKSRIFIKDGAVLMGTIDETGLLPEGCVYIELSTTGRPVDDVDTGLGDNYRPLVGPVMVTKHPVMHPGDVRMLLAVDIRELNGMRNCLIFSQYGNRAEADKMSGSDLDGDEFAATWDSRLFLGEWNSAEKDERGYWISAKDGSMLPVFGDDMATDANKLQEVNHPAMDFRDLYGQPISNWDPPFDDSDLLEFFFKYLQNANLGWIASMWLDYACKNGADCDDCVELAGLHSTAVDFGKSGIPARIPLYLKNGYGPKRAHWREIKGRGSFKDFGVIGQLYDDVIAEESIQDLPSQFNIALAGRKVDRYGQIVCFAEDLPARLKEVYEERLPISLEYNIATEKWEADFDKELLLFARGQMRSYNSKLMGLMNKHKIHSESEVVTGLIRKYHKLNKRRRHAISEEIRRSYRELRRNFREVFFDKVTELIWEERPVKSQELTSKESRDGSTTSEDDSTSDEITMSSEKAQIDLVRAVVEKEALQREVVPLDELGDSETQEEVIRYYSRKLAAAYYYCVYFPSDNNENSKDEARENKEEISHSNGSVTEALFSFAWIMADIIEIGVSSHEVIDRDFQAKIPAP